MAGEGLEEKAHGNRVRQDHDRWGGFMRVDFNEKTLADREIFPVAAKKHGYRLFAALRGIHSTGTTPEWHFMAKGCIRVMVDLIACAANLALPGQERGWQGSPCL